MIKFAKRKSDSQMPVLIQVYGLGPNYKATMAGLNIDYKLAPNFFLNFAYQVATANTVDSKITYSNQSAFSILLKQTTNLGSPDSFYYKAGFDYRTDSAENTTTGQTYSFDGSSTVFDLGIGNQWTSKSGFVFAIDWFGIVAPLSYSLSNEKGVTSSTAKDDDVSKLFKTTYGYAARVNLGYTF